MAPTKRPNQPSAVQHTINGNTESLRARTRREDCVYVGVRESDDLLSRLTAVIATCNFSFDCRKDDDFIVCATLISSAIKIHIQLQRAGSFRTSSDAGAATAVDGFDSLVGR